MNVPISCAGFSNAHLTSMCNALAALEGLRRDKPRLKFISLGPPRELIACEGGFQLRTVSFSADCMAALTAMIATLSSLDLVVVYGLSPEQTEALRAAVPADMEVDTSGEACLRLSSTSM
jgi:hypothetical protein